MKKNRGITLVALVITIIVLLILAGVTISLVIGDNGIIAKGEEAKIKTEIASLKEQVELKVAESVINDKVGNLDGDLGAVIENVSEETREKYHIQNNKLVYTKKCSSREVEIAKGLGLVEEKSMEIGNAEELRNFEKEVRNGNTYQGINLYITSDINLGAIWDENGVLTSGNAFEPIGICEGPYNNLSLEKPFSGVLEGNGHRITGLYISKVNTTDICIGLFAEIGETGKVQNIIIENGYINGYREVGAFAGRNLGTVSNCTNKAKVVATSYDAAGLIGRSFGDVISCNNSGEIISNITAGGIISAVGDSTNIVANSQIRNCINTGKVSGINYNGGIIGYSYGGKIEDCKNKGEITQTKVKDSNYGSGGIMGGCNNAMIQNCQNEGTITGIRRSGGITGYSFNVTIRDCVNIGNINVTGVNDSNGYLSGMAGGIAGWIGEQSIIENCNNSGNINTSTSGIGGGISGTATTESIVQRCYNIGKITGRNQLGGVAGSSIDGAIIRDCYNIGEIVGTEASVGGVTGYLGNETEAMLQRCYNSGKVTANYAAGIVGSFRKGVVENCYSVGTVLGSNPGGVIASLSGPASNSRKISNCYFLNTTTNMMGVENSNIVITKVESKTEQELKSKEILTVLNDGMEGAFKIEAEKNNGYPILSWQ